MTEVNERTDTQPMATASQRWISVFFLALFMVKANFPYGRVDLLLTLTLRV